MNMGSPCGLVSDPHSPSSACYTHTMCPGTPGQEHSSISSLLVPSGTHMHSHCPPPVLIPQPAHTMHVLAASVLYDERPVQSAGMCYCQTWSVASNHGNTFTK